MRPRVDFRHSEVRELAWLLGSPSLLTHDPLALYSEGVVSDRWSHLAFAARLPWLRHLDANPLALQRWLEANPTDRLGHRFELLWEFTLRHWPRARVLLANHKLHGHGRTLGEIDLLWRDRHYATALHWELAVKFMLGHRRADGHWQWLGPDPRDTLEGKWRKLTTAQLPLSDSEAAASTLAALGASAPLAQALFKGYLFYPRGEPLPPEALPDYVSSHHLHGWWAHSDALDLGDEPLYWQVLPHMHWLAPLRLGMDTVPSEASAMQRQISEHFSVSERALMLAGLRQLADGSWCEAERAVVVGPRWPDL